MHTDLKKVIECAGDRIKVAGDILDFTDFFLPDEAFPYDEAAFAKRIQNDAEGRKYLAEFRDVLAEQKPEDFCTEKLDALFHRFLEARQLKPGQLIHALRIAVTGKPNGFGMFETLDILGQTRVIHRIDRTIQKSRENEPHT